MRWWVARSRSLLAFSLTVMLAAPLTAEAQQVGKVFRIGVLSQSAAGESAAEALREGLRERGYVEGRNIAIEWRGAGARAVRFSDFAAELVRLKVDIIVAANTPQVAAAQRATKTVPIVMVHPSDPVGLGFVSSLARPGGNVTGLSGLASELQGKLMQLLKETIPNVSRVAVLWDPTESGRRAQVREFEAAALTVGVRPQLLEVRRSSEVDSAFAAMTRERADAVLVGANATIFAERARIAEHAVQRGLPTICLQSWYVEAGCLMSYGAHFPDLYRRAAYYVDKILKGAKPAELPVEQPTKFELVINLKTARALGLPIPQSLLLRADQIIE